MVLKIYYAMISRSSSALSITKSGASMPFFGIKAVLVGWSEAAAAGDIPKNGIDAPDFVIESAEELLEIIA